MNIYLKIVLVLGAIYVAVMVGRWLVSLFQGGIKGSGKDVFVNILTLGGCKSEAVIVNC